MIPEPPFSEGALIAALRELPDASAQDPAMKQRVQARLAQSLVGLAPAASAPASVSNARELTAQLAPRSVRGLVAAWLAPVFIAGAVAGIWADRWVGRASPALSSGPALPPSAVLRAPNPPAPIPPPSSREPAVTPAPTPELLRSTAKTAPPASAPGVAPSAGSSSAMALERHWLDAARTALSRGEPQAGIASLEQHAKRFPKGTLTEEREALYVRILAAAGNDSAAKARAASFQRRFPASIFMPVVERALLSISRRNGEADPKP